jgi:hypothetical protein
VISAAEVLATANWRIILLAGARKRNQEGVEEVWLE